MDLGTQHTLISGIFAYASRFGRDFWPSTGNFAHTSGRIEGIWRTYWTLSVESLNKLAMHLCERTGVLAGFQSQHLPSVESVAKSYLNISAVRAIGNIAPDSAA